MNATNALALGSSSVGTTTATHSQSYLTQRSDRKTDVNDDVNHEVRTPRRLARIAGLLYLLVGIFGGFAEGFVNPRCTLPATRRPQLRTLPRTLDWSAWASSPTCWIRQCLSSWP
jgi:hypothetical protein